MPFRLDLRSPGTNIVDSHRPTRTVTVPLDPAFAEQVKRAVATGSIGAGKFGGIILGGEQQYARLPINKNPAYAYTVLIPMGSKGDPNSAKYVYVERSPGPGQKPGTPTELMGPISLAPAKPSGWAPR
jgi:hypothetical protein